MNLALERHSELGLRRFDLPKRILITITLCFLGLGWLVAFSFLFLTHELDDGKPGLSADDVKMSYARGKHRCLLSEKLNGSMRGYLTDPVERASLFYWINMDGRERDWPMVEPIVRKNCLQCHAPWGEAKQWPYTRATAKAGGELVADYNLVKVICEEDRSKGSFMGVLLRGHIHFFSMTFLAAILAFIIANTSYPSWLRCLLVVTPFVGVLTDVASWWLTRVNPIFAYAVMGGGAIFGMSYGAIIFLGLWELWGPAAWRTAPPPKTEG